MRERNISIATSGASRPDYALGICFIGEDKTDQNYRRGVLGHDPVVDVLDVTPFKDWSKFFGDLVPFIFAYSAVGSAMSVMFSLGVIVRDTQTFVPLQQSPVNISRPEERPRIMKDILVIMPFLIALEKTVSKNYGWIGDNKMERYSIVPACKKIIERVTRSRQLVLKKSWYFPDHADMVELQRRLIEIFRRMSTQPDILLFRAEIDAESSIKHIAEGGSTFLSGYFLPIGEKLMIANLEEAVTCLLDIANSVSVLMRLGIIHHDISVDNVMKVGDRYFLIDFDDAMCIDTYTDGVCPPFDVNRLSADKHCPSTYRNHGHEVDIWSIGKLMVTLPFNGRQKLAKLGLKVQEEYKTMKIEEVISEIQQIIID